MSPLVLCLLAVCQAPADVPSILEGDWMLVGNGFSGRLSLSVREDDTLVGRMYGDELTGNFDPQTNQVVLRRLHPTLSGPETAQEYSGVLSQVPDSDPPRYVLEGKFKSVAGTDWGDPGVEYDWSAKKRDATGRTDELRELAGQWEVVSAEGTNAHQQLPAEHPLSQAGVRIEIRGNEMWSEDAVAATLANDVYSPTLDLEEGLRYSRRLLILTLPDGRAYLVGYKIDGDGLSLAYPYTMGRIAAGQMIYLKRTEP